MTYNEKLTSLHKALTPIYPDQDRINFAPKMAADIRILLPNNNYLNFNNIDGNGTIWVCSDIEGWWNLSDPSIPNIERGFADGSFDVSGRNLARDLTFNGSILVTQGDRSGIAQSSKDARSTLLGAFDLVKRGTWLIVDEDDYKRACFVRLNGRPNISTVNSRGRIDFSIGLRAADPIKYEWIDDPDSNLEILSGRYNYVFIGGGNPEAGFQTYTNQPYRSDPAALEPSLNPQVDWVTGETPANSDGTAVRSYDENFDEDLTNYYSGDTASVTNISPNTVTVTNHGDSTVYCYFRVIGPFYGPGYIQNVTTSQTINFLPTTNVSGQILGPTDSAPLIEYIDIDTRNREVHKGNFIDGTSTDSSRELLEPLVDWIYLLPGDNSLFFIDTGVGSRTISPSLEIYWRSGWIG
jgi:hypothetical protein